MDLFYEKLHVKNIIGTTVTENLGHHLVLGGKTPSFSSTAALMTSQFSIFWWADSWKVQTKTKGVDRAAGKFFLTKSPSRKSGERPERKQGTL